MAPRAAVNLILLGPPSLELDGRPVHIPRSKAVALLAYLAVEQQAHSRDALAELLWPEYEPGDGRADLSRTLTVLRKLLGDGFIRADRRTVMLDGEAPFWTDAVHFRRLRAVAEQNGQRDRLSRLAEAAEIYRADFLSGFSLPNCPDFDTWQTWQTEALRQEAAETLLALAQLYAAGQEWMKAIATVQRLLTLDPLDESAHRLLMDLYARSGQRSDAMRHYPALVKLLRDELGAEPQPETLQLLERIRQSDGQLPRYADKLQTVLSEPGTPPFLAWPDAESTPNEHFVGRRAEFAWLNSHLDATLKGQGRVLFVRGDAGRGKSTLIAHFLRQAQTAHEDLLAAGGAGGAFAGVGDPYLPFREVLALLTGEVESRLAAGSIYREQAQRLWQGMPDVARLIVEEMPDLLETFLPSRSLLARLRTAIPQPTEWLSRLQERVSRLQPVSDFVQITLFSQFTELLIRLSQKRPLLLVLDDFHWADDASLGLLFHLGRHLAGSRILLIVAYRPAELAVGRQPAGAVLAKIVGELARSYKDNELDLAQTDRARGREFVDELIDAEMNRLDDVFRARLVQQTGGHPLFTIELLQEMKRRGSLIVDDRGAWRESVAMDWTLIPDRVEVVIGQRLDLLGGDIRYLLGIASVEGESFTFEVVAEVAGISIAELSRRLAGDSLRGHELFALEGVEYLSTTGRKLSRYRFSHQLFQAYLYQEQNDFSRSHIHGEVGKALEKLYGEQSVRVSSQLARHFESAHLLEDAFKYRRLAGQASAVVAAYEDAIENFERGLALLNRLGMESSESAADRLALLVQKAECERRAGRVADAITSFRQAAELAHSTQRAEELARIALGYEETRWRLNLPTQESTQLLTAALVALPEADEELRARILTGLVRSRKESVSAQEFAALAKQAIDLARRSGDSQAIFEALYLQIPGERRPEDTLGRIEVLVEMIELAEESGDQEGLHNAVAFLMLEHLETGDMVAFRDGMARSIAIAHGLRQPFYRYVILAYPYIEALLQGELGNAEKAAQQAFVYGQRMGVDNVDGVYGLQMFTVRREQGRLAEIAPLLRHLVSQADAAAYWRPGLALIYADLGNEAAARAAFDEIIQQGLAAIPRDSLWPTSMAYLAEVAARLGEREQAAELYRLLLPYSGRNIVTGFMTVCLGAVDRYLALLAVVLDEQEEAIRHFRLALEMNERSEALIWLAHTQFDYGALLLNSPNPAVRQRGKSLVQHAQETALALDLRGLTATIAAGYERGQMVENHH